MKKLFLTIIMVSLMVSLMACDTNTVKEEQIKNECDVNNLNEMSNTNINLARQGEIEKMKYDLIAHFENVGYANLGDDCTNDLINMIKDVKYDASFEEGFDYEQFKNDYVHILLKHDILPSCCHELSVDEVWEWLTSL